MPEASIGAGPTVVLCTHDPEFGFSATSPNLPGFSYGATTIEQFNEGLAKALDWAGASDKRVDYFQEVLATPEGVEYIVRVRNERQEKRAPAARALVETIGTEQRFPMFASMTPRRTGEYVFIIALPDDRLIDLVQTMDPRGDVLSMITWMAPDQVWQRELIVRGDVAPLRREPEVSLADLGLDLDRTVDEVVRQMSHSASADTKLLIGV